MKAKDIVMFFQTNPNADVVFSGNPPIPASPVNFAFNNEANAYLIQPPTEGGSKPQLTPPSSSATAAPKPSSSSSSSSTKPQQKGLKNEPKKSTLSKR